MNAYDIDTRYMDSLEEIYMAWTPGLHVVGIIHNLDRTPEAT
jgi:hypothetical protein